MRINFKYSYILDLVYHIFAHIKVNNASDLYDENYINPALFSQLSEISDYYNVNFNRLAPIQFILTHAETVDDVSDVLLNNTQFTDNDKQFFIIPFINILRSEDESYSAYWNEINNKNQFEAEISEKFSELKWLFEKYNKDIDIYLSYSITKNGRGIYSPNKYQAVVPYPFHVNPRYDVNHCFYIAFHEITHQITDNMIRSDINMDDGSHDLSEKIVILADYYWLNDKTAYLRWISELFGCDEILTAEKFAEIFKVPKDINDKILQECINK